MSRTYTCRICNKPATDNICKHCQLETSVPCDTCGNPVPTIKRNGKPYKRTRCHPCTTRSLAHTRRIGVKCRVCGNRSTKTKQKYQVCPQCQSITSHCFLCKSEMPKYKKQGKERKYCSNICNGNANPPLSPEVIANIQAKRKITFLYFFNSGFVSVISVSP